MAFFALPRSGRPKRWLLMAAIFLAIASVAAGLAPALVARTSLWPWIVARLTKDFPGRVSTGAADLGWFHPIAIQNIAVSDAGGQPLAKIAAVRTESTLVSLLLHPSRLGIIRLERPELSVHLRDDGSNIEDTIASLMTGDSTTASVTGEVQITNGTVSVRETSPGAGVRLESISALVTLPSAGDKNGAVSVKQCTVTTEQGSGSLTGECSWKTGTESTAWTVKAHTESLPLAALEPVARRFGQDIQLAGSLTTRAACGWDAKNRQLAIEVRQATVEGLQLGAPQWLGPDQLAMQGVTLKGACLVTDQFWQFQRAELDFDAGQLQLHGTVKLPGDTDRTMGQRLLVGLREDIVDLRGRVDLARLAATLPRLLRIREGTEIDSGRVQFQFSGTGEADARRWTAQITTSDLAARRDGQLLAWKEPLQLAVDVRQGSSGWQVDRLKCESSFLTVTGRGAFEEGSIALHMSLDKLVGELGKFVDVDSLRAAGTMTGGLSWQLRPNGMLTTDAHGLIQNLELAFGPRHRWREPRLVLSLAASGQAMAGQERSIQSARLEMSTATDRLELELLEPIPLLQPAPAVAVRCTVRGESASWLTRLRPWLPSREWEMDGPIQLEVSSRLSGEVIAIEQATFEGKPFRLACADFAVNEPLVKANLTGRWNRRTGSWRVTNGTLQSAAVALRASDVVGRLGGGAEPISGLLAFRTDLTRLSSSWRFTRLEPDWRVLGTAQGQVSVVRDGQALTARWTADLNDATIDQRAPQPQTGATSVIPVSSKAGWQTVWHEPALKWTGAGRYDQVVGRLQLDRCEISSASELQLEMSGSVSHMSSRPVVDVKGQLTYDLAKLAERARSFLPADFRISGRDTRQFWVRGPWGWDRSHESPARSLGGANDGRQSGGLVSPELAAQCGLRWQAADLLGIVVGPGLVQAHLNAGTLETDPIELPVSGGSLRIVPHLNLNSQPVLFTVDAGQVLTNVQITPRMCQGWLKYVTPVAADATRAEGRFSMKLREAKSPLSQLASLTASGTLAIHQAQVGPGPLARQLLARAEQIRALVERRVPNFDSVGQTPWLVLPEQNVPFHVADGRVYHDSLNVSVRGLTIRTRGFVGFDQSLSLVAQIPIQDSWLGGDRVSAALRGQVVEIPIRGTLSNPQWDARALEQLSRQLFERATGRLLENELEHGLNQLFGPNR